MAHGKMVSALALLLGSSDFSRCSCTWRTGICLARRLSLGDCHYDPHYLHPQAAKFATTNDTGAIWPEGKGRQQGFSF